MLLKVLTTALVLLGLGLLLGLPFMIGAKPQGADKIELAHYGARLVTYFAATAFSWVGAALCASLLVRRAKREYLDDQRELMQGLIEGTLRDHERKQ
ncbi:MAG TPA: hypothetical protein VNI20_10190 [Fimbriimonadaceae bacterium]|nr:hypothetical protein [Fimbriimonadaceae bacterium]